MRSSNGFHTTLATQAIAHSEHVRHVDAAVTYALEHPQRFKITANAIRTVIDTTGRQLHRILFHLSGQAVEDSQTPPTLGNLTELTWYDHTLQRAQNAVHPGIVLPDLS